MTEGLIDWGLIRDLASWGLFLIGSAAVVTGAIGIVRFPEFYTRVHAAGVTDTGGAELIIVAMMLQADRFGTSIGDSMRVQADSLRVRRRQRAEEMAAKIPLKMLFPLIFCIFPSLLLVLMGPAMIQIYRTLLPTMGGGG